MSFVKVTPLTENQINILIFRGNLSFQRNLFGGIILQFITYLYIDRTVKVTYLFKFQLKTSFWSLSCTYATVATNLFHLFSFSLIKALRKATFSCIVLKIRATNACASLQYYIKILRVKFPNHLSSQKHICDPLFKLKMPRFKNWSLTFIRPDKKCESLGFQ